MKSGKQPAQIQIDVGFDGESNGDSPKAQEAYFIQTLLGQTMKIFN